MKWECSFRVGHIGIGSSNGLKKWGNLAMYVFSVFDKKLVIIAPHFPHEPETKENLQSPG